MFSRSPRATGVASAYGRTLLYGFYDRPIEPWDEVNRPILAATVAFACFAIIGTRVAFALPVTLNANWIFKLAVARQASDYLAATRQVLLLLAVAPVLGLSFALLLSIWPPWPAVGHVLLLALLGLILTDLCLRRLSNPARTATEPNITANRAGSRNPRTSNPTAISVSETSTNM